MGPRADLAVAAKRQNLALTRTLSSAVQAYLNHVIHLSGSSGLFQFTVHSEEINPVDIS